MNFLHKFLMTTMDMKKDAYYFSHDANARNDIKLIRLRRQLGIEGYGIYFCLIEILREQSHHKLPLTSIPDLAFDLNVSEEKIKAVVLTYDLFSMDEESFFSSRLLRSMEDFNANKTRLSQAGRKGGLSRAKAMLKLGSGDAQALKKRKEKKSKVNIDLKTEVEKFKNLNPGKYAENMYSDFLAYWLEGNADGKSRLHKEEFFELSRRLATWFKNASGFKKPVAQKSNAQGGLVL